MASDLDKVDLQITQPMLVEHFYAKLRGIFLHDLSQPTSTGMILDLDSLPSIPPGLKEAVIKWLVNVNLSRITRGDEPIVTLELALKCPVWKIVRPPLVKLKLSKEDVFNKPKVKSIGQKAPVKNINKKR